MEFVEKKSTVQVEMPNAAQTHEMSKQFTELNDNVWHVMKEHFVLVDTV